MKTRPATPSRRGATTRVSRRALWRRAKVRRVAAALLAAVGIWLAVSAASADPEGPHSEVVVAQVDARSGHALTDADLDVTTMPVALVPSGASAHVEDWTGTRLAAPIRAGDVLTDADISIAALADGQPPGYVVTHLPLSSAALARAAPAGARVDVLSTVDGSTLASDVVVLATTEAGDDTGESPGLFVAVSGDEAQAIAVAGGGAAGAALTGSGVTVVLRSPED